MEVELLLISVEYNEDFLFFDFFLYVTDDLILESIIHVILFGYEYFVFINFFVSFNLFNSILSIKSYLFELLLLSNFFI